MTVRASRLETSATTPVLMYFEVKTPSGVYVSHMKVPLRAVTVTPSGGSPFTTRSVFPISSAKVLPFVLVLVPKLFDLQILPFRVSATANDAMVGGNTAVQMIASGNSVSLTSTSNACTFTLVEICRAGWESSNNFLHTVCTWTCQPTTRHRILCTLRCRFLHGHCRTISV